MACLYETKLNANIRVRDSKTKWKVHMRIQYSQGAPEKKTSWESSVAQAQILNNNPTSNGTIRASLYVQGKHTVWKNGAEFHQPSYNCLQSIQLIM
jgi:hypothetical protein